MQIVSVAIIDRDCGYFSTDKDNMAEKQITNSEEETIEFGRKLADKLRASDIVLLYGELGAGKTTLVKGIAEGFGVPNTIVSPTFTLMQAYHCNTSTHQHINTLAHIDTYRLKTEQELIDIGIEDYLGAPDTICVIEWPEKIANLLRDRKTITINLMHTGDGGRLVMM